MDWNANIQFMRVELFTMSGVKIHVQMDLANQNISGIKQGLYIFRGKLITGESADAILCTHE